MLSTRLQYSTYALSVLTLQTYLYFAVSLQLYPKLTTVYFVHKEAFVWLLDKLLVGSLRYITNISQFMFSMRNGQAPMNTNCESYFCYYNARSR